jgi:hypothetical protein
MNGPQTGIPVEIIAAITAALSAVLDQPVGNFVVRSIQPEPTPARPAASSWAKAGLIETHLARRQFGIRTR